MAGFPGQAPAQKLEDDEVVAVPDSNREMVNAITRARETLPTFFRLKSAPEPGQQGFALKVAISDSRNTEHFWLKDIDSKGNGFTGTIDNTPRSVTHVRYGQRYDFPQKDISDWMYRWNGKIYGGYTIRVLLKMIPASEAARLKAMLAFEPK
ncbi:MAG: DUF2314 domain-containing protein [Pseudomonadota bacterium]